MKRYKDKLILDILDDIFMMICKIFDWFEHRIENRNRRYRKKEM